MITLGSLFDGIGGWQLAAIRNGVTPLWSSEIEKFPMEVTKNHFPNTVQLGDIRQIHGGKIPPVDIVCAGSPCQDLSIAGSKQGLDGKHSNLFLESIRVVREMREATSGIYPRFFIWENVTGAFSTNHGNDFQKVLSEIAQTDIPIPKSGRWARAGMVRGKGVGISWRTLDAQYWGVPQRRERIFLVAGFGNWGGTTEVLFKCESLQRDSSESEKEEKETSTGTRNCPVKTVKCIGNGQLNQFIMQDKACALNCMHDQQAILIYSISHPCDVVRVSDKSFTMTSNMGTGGGNVPLIEDSSYIRRLTPLECERLQGLPDNYTNFGSDSARYKAIGNGMAQPCADFVMSKVVEMLTGDINDR